MREVELGEESRRLTWRRVVAEDVLHRAVAEGLIIVGCIEPALVILQRRGVLDLCAGVGIGAAGVVSS